MAIKTQLTGNLVRDPEMKTIGGQQVATFAVGSRTATKGADGNYITNFFDCALWGKRGEYFASHAKKGMRVFVSGDLALTEYESRDGGKRSSLHLNADVAEITERVENNTQNRAAAPARRVENDLPF